ncbi:MAG TPA: hypothetical protein VFI45_09875 [Candidatus Acidoferrum sp.]|nr:hypothetical protein [Candidatus Acidoferrum sp.]
MSKIYIPSKGPDDWQKFLAQPCKQWRTGYSAKTLAHCWERADGLPREIESMIESLGTDVELLLAIPEHKVPLPGSFRGDSQNDVFALVRVEDRTLAIMIEGKVNEPFGDTIGEWLQNASDGKRERLGFLCDLLGLTLPLPKDIYYQLVHRTASAVIEARRFKTDGAAMIVHSFSPDRQRFEDFTRFVSLFGVVQVESVVNQLITARSNTNPSLYLGWACGDYSFLTA